MTEGRGGGHDVPVLLRGADRRESPSAAPGQLPPAAQRSSVGPWRDPRLWAGVLVVAACVVLGARLLAAVDDSVEVWSAAADLGPGDQLGADDLVATRVRFVDAADLTRYLRVEDRLPAGSALTRSVAAGELLPRSALGDPADSGTVQVAVAVDDVRVPSSVTAGSVVDVYLVPAAGSGAAGLDDAGSDGAGSARRRDDLVLEDVTVVASSVDEGFGSVGERKLELAVPSADVADYFRRVAGEPDPVLSVVRQS